MTAPARHRHAEAYCLMTYESDDGTEREQVWNSRDGMTPFVIRLRSGKEATHVNWRGDLYLPGYEPPPGSRVFTDLTRERAEELTARRVDAFLADPDLAAEFLRVYRSRERGTARLLREALAVPGQPDLVDAETWRSRQ